MDKEVTELFRKMGMSESDILIIKDLSDHATKEALAAITRVVQTAPEDKRYYIALMAFTNVGLSAQNALHTQSMEIGARILKGL